jgi:hypothetical protein
VKRAGSARAGRWLRGRGVVAGSVLTLAAMLAGVPPAAAAVVSAARAAGTPRARAIGPFSVDGTQVLGSRRQVFVSYGITVPGLQSLNWPDFVSLDLEKIAATAEDWCANTVRLQLSQDDLLGADGTGFNQAYLTAVESEVTAAEQDHLVVVLNDNTEFATPAAIRR